MFVSISGKPSNDDIIDEHISSTLTNFVGRWQNFASHNHGAAVDRFAVNYFTPTARRLGC